MASAIMPTLHQAASALAANTRSLERLRQAAEAEEQRIQRISARSSFVDSARRPTPRVVGPVSRMYSKSSSRSSSTRRSSLLTRPTRPSLTGYDHTTMSNSRQPARLWRSWLQDPFDPRLSHPIPVERAPRQATCATRLPPRRRLPLGLATAVAASEEPAPHPSCTPPQLRAAAATFGQLL